MLGLTQLAFESTGYLFMRRTVYMSGGRIKLDLDSILQGYGFLTMLPLGDLLNFGNSGNNN